MCDPHAGDLYDFRGRAGGLIKILWHDGIGMSLYAKRLERGRFVWPAAEGVVLALTAAQLGYMIEGIDRPSPEPPRRAPVIGLRAETRRRRRDLNLAATRAAQCARGAAYLKRRLGVFVR